MEKSGTVRVWIAGEVDKDVCTRKRNHLKLQEFNVLETFLRRVFRVALLKCKSHLLHLKIPLFPDATNSCGRKNWVLTTHGNFFWDYSWDIVYLVICWSWLLWVGNIRIQNVERNIKVLLSVITFYFWWKWFLLLCQTVYLWKTNVCFLYFPLIANTSVSRSLLWVRSHFVDKFNYWIRFWASMNFWKTRGIKLSIVP